MQATERNVQFDWLVSYPRNESHLPTSISLIPRPLTDFSPQLWDKIWEWPGNKAMCFSLSWRVASYVLIDLFLVTYYCLWATHVQIFTRIWSWVMMLQRTACHEEVWCTQSIMPSCLHCSNFMHPHMYNIGMYHKLWSHLKLSCMHCSNFMHSHNIGMYHKSWSHLKLCIHQAFHSAQSEVTSTIN